MKKHTDLNPAFFTPSGRNDRFHGDGLSFAEYTQQTREMITAARMDLTPENRDTIIAANSPYEFIPNTKSIYSSDLKELGRCQQNEPPEHNSPEKYGQSLSSSSALRAPSPTRGEGIWKIAGSKKKYKRAMLMVHGLSDAPFALMDMGSVFAQHGFFVRGVLLPGHGTVPADLLHVRYTEWERCVEYGIASLKEIAEEVFVTGFSMGGTLAIQHALKYADLTGLVLLAPALRFTTSRVPFYTCIFQYMQSLSPRFQWFFKQAQTDYAKYQTFTVNAAVETMHLMKKTREAIRKNSCQLPIFVVESADDELISARAAFDFFNKNQYPKQHMLIYGDRLKYLEKFEHIEVKSSVVPEQHIVNFSHPCLSIAPNNPHYGIHADYRDFSHYFGKIPSPTKEIFLGSPTLRTLRKYTLQRLRYNPDFEGMMEEILSFIND